MLHHSASHSTLMRRDSQTEVWMKSGASAWPLCSIPSLERRDAKWEVWCLGEAHFTSHPCLSGQHCAPTQPQPQSLPQDHRHPWRTASSAASLPFGGIPLVLLLLPILSPLEVYPDIPLMASL